jgi:hypothetical protein
MVPLLALAALFFGWRTYEAWTGPVAPAPSAVSAHAASPAGAAFEDAPPPDLSAPMLSIAARPLFRPDRAPYRGEEAAVAPRRNYQAELARLTLLGVLLRDREKKGIVVEKAGGGREERWEVVPGDALAGFTVKDVEADGLTLAADDQEFLLPLYAGGPKVPGGAVSPRTGGALPRQAAPAPHEATPGQAGIGRPSPPPVPAPRPEDGRGRTYRPTYVPGHR